MATAMAMSAIADVTVPTPTARWCRRIHATTRSLRDLDLVKREEFEAVKQMAAKAREENDRLQQRIDELESKLGQTSGPAAPLS